MAGGAAQGQLGAEFWPMVPALSTSAPLDLRVNVLKDKRELVQKELAQAAIKTVAHRILPGACACRANPR
jgi:16S rRNA (cytosine967-C5)-methyltransferase